MVGGFFLVIFVLLVCLQIGMFEQVSGIVESPHIHIKENFSKLSLQLSELP